MSGAKESLSSEKRGFYGWCLNLAASVILVLIWKFLAWAMTFAPGIHSDADHMFMMLVAMSVALNLNRKTS